MKKYKIPSISEQNSNEEVGEYHLLGAEMGNKRSSEGDRGLERFQTRHKKTIDFIHMLISERVL